MTPVRPVGTSSSTLPRQPRPAAVRGRSFAQLIEEESALPAATSDVPSAPGHRGLLDADSEMASAPAHAAVTATRAFGRTNARAAGRHPGQFVDVIV
jgi:hypothetical protein